VNIHPRPLQAGERGIPQAPTIARVGPSQTGRTPNQRQGLADCLSPPLRIDGRAPTHREGQMGEVVACSLQVAVPAEVQRCGAPGPGGFRVGRGRGAGRRCRKLSRWERVLGGRGLEATGWAERTIRSPATPADEGLSFGFATGQGSRGKQGCWRPLEHGRLCGRGPGVAGFFVQARVSGSLPGCRRCSSK